MNGFSKRHAYIMKPTHVSPYPPFASTSVSMNDQLSWMLCDLLAEVKWRPNSLTENVIILNAVPSGKNPVL